MSGLAQLPDLGKVVTSGKPLRFYVTVTIPVVADDEHEALAAVRLRLEIGSAAPVDGDAFVERIEGEKA